MHITIEKPGKPDCKHEYVYSNQVVLTYPEIYHRICKHCGQVEELQDELPPREPSFEELSRQFWGKVVR